MYIWVTNYQIITKSNYTLKPHPLSSPSATETTDSVLPTSNTTQNTYEMDNVTSINNVTFTGEYNETTNVLNITIECQWFYPNEENPISCSK